ncbi:MAG: class I SAM-dependent methyltransferase, partial [Acidimicrobiales bacterium]
RGFSPVQDVLVSFYGDQVVPRFIDVVLRGEEFSSVRERATSGLAGEVLEVGFGSGLNVPHYPREVRRVWAVDPAKVGRRLAAKRVAESQVPVEYVGLAGESLPLDSESVDNVLITWTMCTIPDVESALREMRRVLRPAGRLHFAEHGLSPEPQVAKWQHRITPFQRRVAGGCHVDRPIDRLITEAGFSFENLDNFYMKGPKAIGYMFVGVAGKA